jgi:prepilin-type N-terminal cleavage/methylation domain-containing protein
MLAQGMLFKMSRGGNRQMKYNYKGQTTPRQHGFTLTEVVVSLAITAMIFGGVIYGYVFTAYQAEYSSYSLAAQSLAMQGIEQARAAKWDPQAWPPVDDLGVTNYVQLDMLDVPQASGIAAWATNYISITTVTVSPPLRELRADCVWSMCNLNGRTRGPFTNTAITLRTADQ